MNRSVRPLTYVFALCTVVMFSMCASAKQYTSDTLPAEHLLFSWGGGFTAQLQEYLVLKNGQVFQRKRVIEELPWRERESLSPKATQDLFDTYEKQNFADLGYDDPGNTTYTIEYTGEQGASKVVWGGSDVKPNEAVRTYWRRVMGLMGE